MLSHLLVSIEISRPHNMLAVALCVAAGYHVAGGAGGSPIWFAAIAAAVVTGAGNIINDYFDLEIDRVNKPRRPLPSMRISRRAAIGLYVSLSAAALVASFVFLPLSVALLMLAWQVALAGYAAAFKRVFVVGNVLVAALTSSAFVAGALLAGRPGDGAIPFAFGFLFVMAREMVKGAEDIEGDSAAGVGTFAVVLGIGRTVTLASAIMLGLAALIPLPALLRHYGAWYLWTMELLVVPGLLVSVYLILSRAERRTFNRVSWILKAGMFFGMLAIAVARS